MSWDHGESMSGTKFFIYNLGSISFGVEDNGKLSFADWTEILLASEMLSSTLSLSVRIDVGNLSAVRQPGSSGWALHSPETDRLSNLIVNGRQQSEKSLRENQENESISHSIVEPVNSD